MRWSPFVCSTDNPGDHFEVTTGVDVTILTPHFWLVLNLIHQFRVTIPSIKRLLKACGKYFTILQYLHAFNSVQFVNYTAGEENMVQNCQSRQWIRKTDHLCIHSPRLRARWKKKTRLHAFSNAKKTEQKLLPWYFEKKKIARVRFAITLNRSDGGKNKPKRFCTSPTFLRNFQTMNHSASPRRMYLVKLMKQRIRLHLSTNCSLFPQYRLSLWTSSRWSKWGWRGWWCPRKRGWPSSFGISSAFTE